MVQHYDTEEHREIFVIYSKPYVPDHWLSLGIVEEGVFKRL